MAPLSVDGVAPGRVVAPGSVEELSSLLAEGAAAGESVVFCSFGTKLDWARPPTRLDTLVDLTGLPAVIEHAAGDLVVRASASVGLAALNGELARAGQRLAIDEVVPGSSLGGVVATGLSGPRRHGFGSVRDLLIGISIVRADGVRAKAGGRVVKNVAGYDLGKLFCGSYGTLGAITEVIFRLHPLPAATAYCTIELADDATAAGAVRAVAASVLAPVAVELERDPDGATRCCVVFEGSEKSVDERAEALAALVGEEVLASDEAPEGFGRLPGNTTLKLTFAPGSLATLLSGLSELPGGAVELRGPAAVGVVHLGIAAARLRAVLEPCRRLAASCGGSAVVLVAPRGSRLGLDVFGPMPAPALQLAVKASFDPDERLAPGRVLQLS